MGAAAAAAAQSGTWSPDCQLKKEREGGKGGIFLLARGQYWRLIRSRSIHPFSRVCKVWQMWQQNSRGTQWGNSCQFMNEIHRSNWLSHDAPLIVWVEASCYSFLWPLHALPLSCIRRHSRLFATSIRRPITFFSASSRAWPSVCNWKPFLGTTRIWRHR